MGEGPTLFVPGRSPPLLSFLHLISFPYVSLSHCHRTSSAPPLPPMAPRPSHRPKIRARAHHLLFLRRASPWKLTSASPTHGCPIYGPAPHLKLVIDGKDEGCPMVGDALLLVLTGAAASHGCDGAPVLPRARAPLCAGDSEAAGGRGDGTASGGRRCYDAAVEVLLRASGRGAFDGQQICYRRQREMLQLAAGGAAGGSVAANGDRARRCSKRRLLELPTEVVGAATGGRLCCKQWSSELPRTSVMRPMVLSRGSVAANGDRARRCSKRRLPELPTEVVSAATGGRLCCKQWSSELPRTSEMRPAVLQRAGDSATIGLQRCYKEVGAALIATGDGADDRCRRSYR
jgi:hypothetical protein